MKLDVDADIDHMFMVNFSAPAARLERLVPRPMRLLTQKGRGYASLVLPRIRNLRPAGYRFPRVSYELFGLRLLVEYDSRLLGATRGGYFARLVLAPGYVRIPANLLTPFEFERGSIQKLQQSDGSYELLVRFAGGETAFSARVMPSAELAGILTEGSSFGTADEALAMYHDLAFGFLHGGAGATHVLQLAEPNVDYKSWPIRDLKVEMGSLELPAPLAECGLTLEPSYFVGFLSGCWRWLPTEQRPQAARSPRKVMVEGAV